MSPTPRRSTSGAPGSGLPIVVFFVTRSGARALKRSEAHPLRGWQGMIVGRSEDGRARELQTSQTSGFPAVSEQPVGTVPGSDDDYQTPDNGEGAA